MYSLEDRIIRRNLVQVFKFKKHWNTEGLDFYTEDKTKILNKKNHVLTRKGGSTFYNRIIDILNNLTMEHIGNAANVGDFNIKLDVYW